MPVRRNATPYRGRSKKSRGKTSLGKKGSRRSRRACAYRGNRLCAVTKKRYRGSHCTYREVPATLELRRQILRLLSLAPPYVIENKEQLMKELQDLKDNNIDASSPRGIIQLKCLASEFDGTIEEEERQIRENGKIVGKKTDYEQIDTLISQVYTNGLKNILAEASDAREEIKVLITFQNHPYFERKIRNHIVRLYNDDSINDDFNIIGFP